MPSAGPVARRQWTDCRVLKLARPPRAGTQTEGPTLTRGRGKSSCTCAPLTFPQMKRDYIQVHVKNATPKNPVLNLQSFHFHELGKNGGCSPTTDASAPGRRRSVETAASAPCPALLGELQGHSHLGQQLGCGPESSPSLSPGARSQAPRCPLQQSQGEHPRCHQQGQVGASQRPSSATPTGMHLEDGYLGEATDASTAEVSREAQWATEPLRHRTGGMATQP